MIGATAGQRLSPKATRCAAPRDTSSPCNTVPRPTSGHPQVTARIADDKSPRAFHKGLRGLQQGFPFGLPQSEGSNLPQVQAEENREGARVRFLFQRDRKSVV